MSRAGRLLAAASAPRVLGVPGYGALLDRLAGSRALPDPVRDPLARDLAAGWTARDQPERGDAVLRAASRRSQDPPASAALAARALERALDRGTLPPQGELRGTIEACLGQADQLLDRGDDRAPRLLASAAALTFHRQRHLAGDGSPFATPAGVEAELAAYRASRAWTRVTSPRPRPLSGLDSAPRRLAVVHDDDDRFVQPLVRQWQEEGLDVRVVGLGELARAHRIDLPRTLGAQIELRWAGAPTGPWVDVLAEALGDVDAVWQEWAQRGAVLTSMVATTPVAVRVHSFELFTAFPHLIDTSPLTGVATVSAPLHRLACALLPAWAGLPHAIVPPSFDPTPFQRPKRPEASRTLGLVGWAAPDKDAVWALDVLAALRSTDPAWRLRLIGPAPDAARWPAYAARVAARLADPDVRGAVDFAGQVSDMPEELTRVGVGLSSSLRESFHLGLAELAASGALPVARDWPTLASWGGIVSIWPAAWISPSPEHAAARIAKNGAELPTDNHVRSPDVARDTKIWELFAQ